MITMAHLPEAPYGDPVRAVAPQVRDDDVCRVRFQGCRKLVK